MSPCDHAAMTSATCGWCSSCSEPFDRRTFCPSCHVEAAASDEVCGNALCRQPRPAEGWSHLPRQLGGGYTLLMGMGRGHWGAVYVARKAGGQEVAARVCYLAGRRPDAARLFEQRCSRERTYQRFLANYDDIVQTLDSGPTAAGVPYLIMELVRGNTLERTLGRPRGGGDMINRTREAALDPVRVVRLIRRIWAALGHLHHHKLVHGQLKPSNIFLLSGPQGEQVKLGDMGLAWLQAGSSRGARIKLGPDQVSPASAPYMSPEQVRGEAQLKPSSDIYSLGVITYEMLTGRLPHDISDQVHGSPDRQEGVDLSARRWGRFASGWLKAHLCASPVPLRSVRPDLPPALEGLLEDCLVRDPGERLRDTDAVIMQLAMLEQELARGSFQSFSPAAPVENKPGGAPLADAPRAARSTGPLPSPASLGKGALMSPAVALPASLPVSPPRPVAPARKVGEADLFGSPASGPGVMELAMERDKLTLEVARLRREVAHLTAENQQLRQRLEALQSRQAPQQAKPGRAAAPAAAASTDDAARTQEQTPVGDAQSDGHNNGRDRVTRILESGVIPDDVPSTPAPRRPFAVKARKVPFGGDLDDLATNIAPSKLLDHLVEAANLEDFVNLDTATGQRQVDQLLEDQPTHILETDVSGLDDDLDMGEMTNVIPQDEIFVDVDSDVDHDATAEHRLRPLATTVDRTRFDDE